MLLEAAGTSMPAATFIISKKEIKMSMDMEETIEAKVIAFKKLEKYKEIEWLLKDDYENKLNKQIIEDLQAIGKTKNDRKRYAALYITYLNTREHILTCVEQKQDLLDRLNRFNKWALSLRRLGSFTVKADGYSSFKFSYEFRGKDFTWFADRGAYLLAKSSSFDNIDEASFIQKIKAAFTNGVKYLAKEMYAYIDYQSCEEFCDSKRIIFTPDGRELFSDERHTTYDKSEDSNPEFGKKSLDDFIKEDYETARMKLDLAGYDIQYI